MKAYFRREDGAIAVDFIFEESDGANADASQRVEEGGELVGIPFADLWEKEAGTITISDEGVGTIDR
jgi:hypothetical protein